MPISKTAYHEAGHACLCAHFGGRVKSVDIHSVDGRDGLTKANMPGRPSENMAVHLAGAIAGWIAGGRQPGESLRGASGDVVDAQELAEFMADKPVDLRTSAYYQPGLQLALKTIDQLWPAIEHVAARLATHRAVSGALVHEIVRQFNLEKEFKHDHKICA